MCDPTMLAIGSTVAGLAGTAVNSMGAMSAQNKQKQEYEAWMASQKKNRQLENQRQEQQRQQAAAAHEQGLQQIGSESAKGVQSEEEARLAAYLQGQDQQNTPDPAAPASIADKTLSGQQGGDETFQEDLAKKINSATASSKQRIAALARVQSYGGSSGGLDQNFTQSMASSGSAIDRANDARRGSMSAYGSEQAVDPVQVTYTPGVFGQLASGLLSAGSQGLGAAFAGSAAPAAAKSAAPTVNYTGAIPVPRPYPGYNLPYNGGGNAALF